MPQILREPAQRFLFVGIAALLIIMGGSVTLLYWSLDLEYPMSGVTGAFRGWDEHDQNIGRVEWTGQRNRYCSGRIKRWVINDGKYVKFEVDEFYGDAELTPEEKGRPDTVYAEIRIPPEVRKTLKDAKYRIRLEYACNLLQWRLPIVVQPPEVSLMSTESSPNDPPGIRNGESTPRVN